MPFLPYTSGGLADNVLKPMLLGRGVDAPMPVVLIGALGGMMASGLIGGSDITGSCLSHFYGLGR